MGEVYRARDSRLNRDVALKVVPDGFAGEYMAPEQARGKAVDKRADIWAFGVVLFELLAGRRLIGGDDVSDTLAFVLTKEPDWAALPPATPASLRRLLRRCLEKDRTRRLADIADARLDVDEALQDLSGIVGVSSGAV